MFKQIGEKNLREFLENFTTNMLPCEFFNLVIFLVFKWKCWENYLLTIWTVTICNLHFLTTGVVISRTKSIPGIRLLKKKFFCNNLFKIANKWWEWSPKHLSILKFWYWIRDQRPQKPPGDKFQVAYPTFHQFFKCACAVLSRHLGIKKKLLDNFL